MMQTKRTDGPWCVDTGVDGIVIKQVATQRLIASLNPISRAQADAHTIAAGPEMRNALSDLLRLFIDIDAGEHDDAPELVAARYALAKASGASS